MRCELRNCSNGYLPAKSYLPFICHQPSNPIHIPLLVTLLLRVSNAAHARRSQTRFSSGFPPSLKSPCIGLRQINQDRRRQPSGISPSVMDAARGKGRPKGSKDKPRPPGAPKRGRPKKIRGATPPILTLTCTSTTTHPSATLNILTKMCPIVLKLCKYARVDILMMIVHFF